MMVSLIRGIIYPQLSECLFLLPSLLFHSFSDSHLIRTKPQACIQCDGRGRAEQIMAQTQNKHKT